MHIAWTNRLERYGEYYEAIFSLISTSYKWGTVFLWMIKMPLDGASQQSQQGHSWVSKHGWKHDYMWYFMVKHVFNSDIRLLGTCDFFKFLGKN